MLQTPYEMITNANCPQPPEAIQLAEGAKNLWGTSSTGNTLLDVCTYNVRTLLGEDRLQKLLSQIGTLNWDILGLSETRMNGENLHILNGGHVLYTMGHETESLYGVGILVHRKLAGNIIN